MLVPHGLCLYKLMLRAKFKAQLKCDWFFNKYFRTFIPRRMVSYTKPSLLRLYSWAKRFLNFLWHNPPFFRLNLNLQNHQVIQLQVWWENYVKPVSMSHDNKYNHFFPWTATARFIYVLLWGSDLVLQLFVDLFILRNTYYMLTLSILTYVITLWGLLTLWGKNYSYHHFPFHR